MQNSRKELKKKLEIKTKLYKDQKRKYTPQKKKINN